MSLRFHKIYCAASAAHQVAVRAHPFLPPSGAATSEENLRQTFAQAVNSTLAENTVPRAALQALPGSGESSGRRSASSTSGGGSRSSSVMPLPLHPATALSPPPPSSTSRLNRPALSSLGKAISETSDPGLYGSPRTAPGSNGAITLSPLAQPVTYCRNRIRYCAVKFQSV
jgi:hypothetical protein